MKLLPSICFLMRSNIDFGIFPFDAEEKFSAEKSFEEYINEVLKKVQ